MARIDNEKFKEKKIFLRKQKEAGATYCCGKVGKEK